MEKSIAPTKYPLKLVPPPPESPPEVIDSLFNWLYGEDPIPEDNPEGRTDGVRPKVEVLGDGSYAMTTYFEDAEPKEFKVLLKAPTETEPEVGPEDADAFNLYSDTETKDEIDYSGDPESKPLAPAEKENEKPKPKLNILEKRRLNQKKRDAHFLPRLLSDLQALQPTYTLTPTYLKTKLQDPTTKTKTQYAELQLYVLAIKARKWAHRIQALAEEISFAQTEEGKKKDEETLKMMEEEAKERVKARKEIRKGGQGPEEKKLKRAKMGNYEVGEGSGRGKGGRGGRGERGGGRRGGRGRGRGRGKGDAGAKDGVPAPVTAGESAGPSNKPEGST